MKLRPRYSLRALFVLVAITSLPLGWVAYNLNWIRARRAYMDDGYPVEYFDRKLSAPGWLGLFGEYGAARFGLEIQVDRLDPSKPVDSYEQVQYARNLFPEAEISVQI